MKKLTFAIATNNHHKVLEFQSYFASQKIEILTPKMLGINFEVEETGDTFQENAAIKSKSLFERTGIDSISDDSGICVNSLEGNPGIYSARYGNSDFSDKERAFFLLQQMKDKKDRHAHYHCSIALTTENNTYFFDGKCFGLIADDYDETGLGFGYDPIFYFPPLRKRFSQISREEKAKVSHRGIALKKFSDYIKNDYLAK